MVAIPLRREALLKTTRKIANLGNKNFNVLCPHCGKMKNLLSPKFFSVKSTLVIYLVNALLSRNFCQKSMRESKFP